MYAQLGQFLFEGLLGFESYSSTDSTTYAQHDLINIKPTLQPTGNELEELTISVHLHASFVKPEQAILEWKKAKDSFQMLPLLKGNGRFMGNFVITQMAVTDNVALADGSIVDATVSLTLKEYTDSGKLQQEQVAARKNAFATGDIKPNVVAKEEPSTDTQKCGEQLADVQSRSDVVQDQVSQYENNVSAQPAIQDKIISSLQVISTTLTSFSGNISALQLPDQDAILLAVGNVQSKIGEFNFPVAAPADLINSNEAFQQSIEQLRDQCSGIINQVITRAA